MITVWATYRNIDMTEGRGPMVLDKVFTKEEDAQAYVMTKDGVMGRKPSDFGATSWDGMGDWKVEPIAVLDGLEDAHEYEHHKLVRSALAKLSPAERKALGLDSASVG